MSAASTNEGGMAVGLLVGGLLLLLGATAWAVRPRRAGRAGEAPEAAAAASSAFTWIVIAGFAYSLLGLAAAVREPGSAGLTAALLQLLAVLLAAALGAASLGAAGEENPPRARVASAGFLVAWLSLVGLPPAMGFHAKLLIYRALLSAGWGWAVAAAMAGSVAALVAAFFAASLYQPSALRGLRVFWVLLLLAVVVALGIYPEAGIAVVTPIARLVVGP